MNPCWPWLLLLQYHPCSTRQKETHLLVSLRWDHPLVSLRWDTRPLVSLRWDTRPLVSLRWDTDHCTASAPDPCLSVCSRHFYGIVQRILYVPTLEDTFTVLPEKQQAERRSHFGHSDKDLLFNLFCSVFY